MKRLICILLAAAMLAACLCACSDAIKLDRIDTGSVKHISIATGVDSDPSYNIVKRKGVVEFVDLYNTTELEAADGVKADDLLMDAVCLMRFYDDTEKVIAECCVTESGYLFRDGDLSVPYKLLKGFDSETILELAEQFNSRAIAK